MKISLTKLGKWPTIFTCLAVLTHTLASGQALKENPVFLTNWELAIHIIMWTLWCLFKTLHLAKYLIITILNDQWWPFSKFTHNELAELGTKISPSNLFSAKSRIVHYGWASGIVKCLNRGGTNWILGSTVQRWGPENEAKVQNALVSWKDQKNVEIIVQESCISGRNSWENSQVHVLFQDTHFKWQNCKFSIKICT